MSGQRLSLAKGLNAGLRRAMERDPKVVLMGEDVGKLGGVFRITEGLQKDFGPDRVVVVARHVGRDEESSWVTTLGELDVEAVDMGCLVVIGASTTRVTDDGRVWTPRSVG